MVSVNTNLLHLQILPGNVVDPEIQVIPAQGQLGKCTEMRKWKNTKQSNFWPLASYTDASAAMSTSDGSQTVNG